MNLANNNKLKLNRMKKLTFLKLALITALTCVIVTSCGKDDGDVTPPGQTEIEKETGMRLTGVGADRFDYDNKGRCISIYNPNRGDYSLNIDWNKGEIIATENYEFYELMQGLPVKFKTNGNGYITELSQSWNEEDGYLLKGSEKASMSYDKSGHLIKVTFTSSETGMEDGEKYAYKGECVYTFTWEDDNLVHAKYVDNYTENGESNKDVYDFEITYDYNAENLYRQWSESLLFSAVGFDCSELGHMGMFGVGTKNFPARIYIEREGDSYYDDLVSISTNDLGLIVSEKFGYYNPWNYSYNEAGTRSSAFDNLLPTKAKKRPLHHHRKMWK